MLPTIRSLFSLLSMLIVNRLCRRFGTCKMIAAGNLLVVACYLGFALSDSFFAYCMVSKVLCADLYDRIGGWCGNFCVCGTAAVGLLLLALSSSGCIPLVFLAVFLYGFGLSSGSISTYQWSADLYGANGYADGVRSFNMAYTAGELAFGPLPGIIADWTGSYVPAFVLFLGIFIVAFAMLQGLYRQLGLHKR